MTRFAYVYILKSQSTPDRFYAGLTSDLRTRLRAHNDGKVSHTSKFAPWEIKTAIAFTDHSRAGSSHLFLRLRDDRPEESVRLVRPRQFNFSSVLFHRHRSPSPPIDQICGGLDLQFHSIAAFEDVSHYFFFPFFCSVIRKRIRREKAGRGSFDVKNGAGIPTLPAAVGQAQNRRYIMTQARLMPPSRLSGPTDKTLARAPERDSKGWRRRGQ
jgi:putative endonuclease